MICNTGPREENDAIQKENEGLALVSNLPGPSKPLLGIIITPFPPLSQI